MKFKDVARYTLKVQFRNTVIINELNIFNFSNRVRNNRLSKEPGMAESV
jgi:hypothetical protein